MMLPLWGLKFAIMLHVGVNNQNSLQEMKKEVSGKLKAGGTIKYLV